MKLYSKESRELKILDIRNEIPRHKTKKWSKRKRTDNIIFHQSVSKTDSINSVANYHVSETKDRNGNGIVEAWERNHISDTGCPSICYVLGITFDGSVYLMNDYDDRTWHCSSRNSDSLGVVVFGDYSGPSHEGIHVINDSQEKAIKKVSNKLCVDFDLDRSSVKGHCEFDPINKENCPGNDIMGILKEWRTDVG